MNRIVVQSRVGADGVLQLSVPIGVSDADRAVEVTIEPADAASSKQIGHEEWRNFVLSTAGSVTDPSFMRHEQGDYERREEFP